MKRTDATKLGRAVAALAILVAVAVVMRPVPTQAFFPIDLVGAVVNTVAGETVGEEVAPSAEAIEERSHRTSFAETIFGTDRDAGASTMAQAVREQPLIREVLQR